MSAEEAPVELVDNRERGRFEIRHEGKVIGLAAYAVVPASESEPERVVFFHTEVKPEYEGQGLAGRLAAHALDSTIAAGRTIVAVCPYIKVYVRRHAEQYAAHVSHPTPADVTAVNRAADALAARGSGPAE
jgi:predicted GNAT family acetyltransferase